ncbi:hypothetical protein [Bowmanella sp. JS7-9]|uniref:Outer membrane lipoprotein-sorting protein n=1 Tax=Pseudobowmanella zhangzhouensis TaxID=1537679 RepID=A0ABW1XKH1_9ALTE|nr:hypothetical protein [Bowmanella sp. JS7-9]
MKRILLAGVLLISAGAQANILIDGNAVSLDKQQPVYSEHYKIEQGEDGRNLRAEVEYRYPNGQVFATKSITYSDKPGMPSIDFTDLRSGVRTRATPEQDGIRVEHLRPGKSDVKVVDYPRKRPVVVDAGFDRFVKDNWQRLLDGEKLHFAFFPIDRGELVDFSLKLVSSNQQQVELKLAPDSFLVSLVVDPITLLYDSQQRLLEYRGLTNIEQGDHSKLKGKNYLASIRYMYPQNADKK